MKPPSPGIRSNCSAGISNFTPTSSRTWAENAGPSEEYAGYWDVSADAYEANWETAIETLKKYYTFDEATGMFTNFPTKSQNLEWIRFTSSNSSNL